MVKNKNVVVTLGLQLDAFGNPSRELEQRVGTAVDLFKKELAPYLIMSGSHSFNATPVPPRSEAAAMAAIAIDSGVPAGAVIKEPRSLCTIGNALKVKEILDANPEWHDLAVVTSPTHLPRTMMIFKHVLGADYNIEGVSSGESPDARDNAAYEAIALQTARTIFEGTEPGDSFTIGNRLVELVPAYSELYSNPLRMPSWLQDAVSLEADSFGLALAA